jgi:hypothetical protein
MNHHLGPRENLADSPFRLTKSFFGELSGNDFFDRLRTGFFKETFFLHEVV